MSSITVVPSLPAQSITELLALTDALRGAITEIQVDIVDGQFVEAVSWPFTEEDPVSAFKELSGLPDELKLEIDCMVNEPEQYAGALAGLPITRVVVHYGSTGRYNEILSVGKARGYRMGLGFTNDIFEAEDVITQLEKFDYVQVMGIKAVGAQGQPFDERTYTTVATLRKQYPELEIAVDGGVNEDTIAALVAAGATRLAPGSAVAKAENPCQALRHLRELAGVSELDKSPLEND